MLKLAALDAEDLAVISAQMQDAVLLAGDMSYSRQRQQFALVANRYAWDEAGGTRQRRRTGLNFNRVTAARVHGIDQRNRDAVLSLLAITFEPLDPPSGIITLAFAGGGSIKLSVECIEARLSDMGNAWATARTPSHPGAGNEG
jgi:hypothetical protein